MPTKRLMDVLCATACLVVLCPLLAVVALAIWLDDRGPVIYRGQRVGRNGRPFFILKFRTMAAGAGQTRTSEITLRDDPRVTRVGRLLRVTKLDELPQLVNVVRGEMSLVGPRPEVPHYVAFYSAEQRAVLAVRPGITGPSQLRFRHEEALLDGHDPDWYYRSVLMPAKLALDLDYARHRSLGGDLKLVALTALAMLRPRQRAPIPTANEMAATTVTTTALRTDRSEVVARKRCR